MMLQHMIALCGLALLLASATSLRISSDGDEAAQRASASTRAIKDVGPRMGERVPDFAATDHQGRPQTLASVLGKNGAMLVFYRSADW